MNVIEKVNETELIGREFLVWLWFRSETGDGIVDLGDDGQIEIRFGGKMTLESGMEEAMESVTCSGDHSLLKEARYALTKNKKITNTAIRLIIGDDEYSFTLDAKWMNYRSFKTPRVFQDDKDDPEGLFYEKAGLMEKAITTMDSIFIHFIKLRISPDWKNKELPALIRWVQKGRN
jgi:recombination associated protein RdgC